MTKEILKKAVSSYKKMTTKDGVSVIVGSLPSGCTQAFTSLAQAQKVLVVAPAATMPSITDAGNYIFRACFIDPFQGTVAGKIRSKRFRLFTAAAILYDAGNDYSAGLYENFKTAFEAAGGTVVAEESYSTGDKDFNAQLVTIKNANPDVIYLPDYYAVVSLITSNCALGITAQLLGGDGWDGIIDHAGDEIVGTIYSNHYAVDSTEERIQNFQKKMFERFNEEPTSFSACLRFGLSY